MKRISTLVFIAGFFLVSANSYARPAYQVTDLGNILPHAINNKGQVVGELDNFDGTVSAVLWENGKVTDLGLLEGSYSATATDISDNGAIVGYTETTGFLRQGTALQAVPMLWAVAVNEEGQIAGLCESGMDYFSAVWHDGSLTPLGALPGETDTGLPRDMNNLGQVVGYADFGGTIHATFWDSDGTAAALPVVRGTVYSEAKGVNDSGGVVGCCRIPVRGKMQERAVYWNPKTQGVEDLGTLGGKVAEAWDINNRGQIVGYALTPKGSYHAFICDAGGRMKDLNKLIGGSNWVLVHASSINDAGRIVCVGYRGGDAHGLLLTPL